MRASLVIVMLAACGSDSGSKTDAKVFLDGAGSGSGSGTLKDCADYCSTITDACSGANSQYGSMLNCIDSCAHFPVGAAGLQAGDNLQCRDYHAHAALTDPGTHCVHAGPSGGGVCGNPCDGFCDLAVAECSTQYPQAGTCATQCASMTPGAAFNSAIQSGNNLSCRIYHATAASTDPGTHCPHIAPPSAPPCQ